jgi:hypothetical protein
MVQPVVMRDLPRQVRQLGRGIRFGQCFDSGLGHARSLNSSTVMS